MKMLLKMLERHMPTLIKRWQLQGLFRITAASFQCRCPLLPRGTPTQALQYFAEFTREQVLQQITQKQKNTSARKRLFQGSYRMGVILRRLLHLKQPDEQFKLLQILYRNIEIEWEKGAVLTVSHCYFSKFYSKEICQFMSAMDEGFMAGLFHGARLTFYRRITEGNPCCKAYLKKSIRSVGD
jgi:hypothetical protein